MVNDMKRLSDRWMYYCGILAGTGMNIEVEDLKHIQNLIDAEEQGLLLKLPCKVGDVVYFVERKYDRANKDFVSFVHSGYVKAIKFSSRPTKVTIEYEDVDDSCGRCKGKDIHASNIGKAVFLTKAEAEKALEEMEK